MLRGELPSSFGGNRAPGEVKYTPVGFIPVAARSLLSLEVGKVQNAPLAREGSTNPKSRKISGLWRNSWQKPAKPVPRVACPKSREGDDPLTYIFFLEKTFTSNHMDVYLEEQRIC